MTFEQFLKMYRSQRDPLWSPPDQLLVLDPGETIGWAVFLKGSLNGCGESSLHASPHKVLISLCKEMMHPDVIVTENYRVYPWKLRDHSWSAGYTLRVLGMIEGIAEEDSILLCKQMASLAKGFCHNRRLREWGYYRTDTHARDAIRHGCYWLLFNKEDFRKWKKNEKSK